MNSGRIEQLGTPHELYERPANEFTARFMGEINIVLPGSSLIGSLKAPADRKWGFRPESARLVDEGVSATVRQATYLGSKTELRVALPTGEELKIWTHERLTTGDNLHFAVETDRLIPL
jgi:putative spermidine/putrescine transport system ATP-binding protein